MVLGKGADFYKKTILINLSITIYGKVILNIVSHMYLQFFEKTGSTNLTLLFVFLSLKYHLNLEGGSVVRQSTLNKNILFNTVILKITVVLQCEKLAYI